MVTIQTRFQGLSVLMVRAPVPVATAKLNPVTDDFDIRWDLWPVDQPAPAPEPDRYPVDVPVQMTLFVDGFRFDNGYLYEMGREEERPHVAFGIMFWNGPVGSSVEIDVFGPGLRLCSGPIRVTREL